MATADIDKVVSWNAKVGRNAGSVMDGLGEILDNTGCDVACLQEFGGYVAAARDTFGVDWYIYAQGGWDESQMNPVMVRKANHSKKQQGAESGWDVLRTTTTWVGPQGGSHKGRTWTYVKVSGVWVMSLHRCTDGNGKNQAAFKEESQALTKWMQGHSPCLVIGDHNCGPKATYYWASKPTSQAAGGNVSHPGGGVDYALQLGVKGDVVTKGKHGSDHAAVVWKRK